MKKKKILSVVQAILCLFVSFGLLFMVLKIPLLADKTTNAETIAYEFTLFAILAHTMAMGQYKFLLPDIDFLKLGIVIPLIVRIAFILIGAVIFVIFICIAMKFLLMEFTFMGLLGVIFSILLLASFWYKLVCEEE